MKRFRWLPLLALLCIMLSFFYFHLYRFFTFESLRVHRHLLIEWTQAHYCLTVVCYMLVFIILASSLIPMALFLTLTGGFLFGIWFGALFAISSAVIGGMLFVLAMKTALSDWFEKKAGAWLLRMEEGIEENAFNYLLTMRLIPVFPFWLVNLGSALFNVRLSIFIGATVLGMIPATLIYASVGNNLGSLFEMNQTPDINIIFQPHFLFPLLGLAALSIVPAVYRQFKNQNY